MKLALAALRGHCSVEGLFLDRLRSRAHAREIRLQLVIATAAILMRTSTLKDTRRALCKSLARVAVSAGGVHWTRSSNRDNESRCNKLNTRSIALIYCYMSSQVDTRMSV